MTIQLPNDLESSVQAVVHSGRFASLEPFDQELQALVVVWPC
jgi:hypothetical protein